MRQKEFNKVEPWFLLSRSVASVQLGFHVFKKKIVVVAQYCDYSKNPWIAQFKSTNLNVMWITSQFKNTEFTDVLPNPSPSGPPFYKLGGSLKGVLMLEVGITESEGDPEAISRVMVWGSLGIGYLPHFCIFHPCKTLRALNNAVFHWFRWVRVWLSWKSHQSFRWLVSLRMNENLLTHKINSWHNLSQSTSISLLKIDCHR